MNAQQKLILNGKVIAEEKATFSPINRGLMYGDGCFETLRSYGGKLLGWELHYQRLKDGLEYLGMKPPLSSKAFRTHISQLLEENDLTDTDAFIRLQCWREGERGYAGDSTSASWMMQAQEYHPKETPISLALAATRCIPSAALQRRYKLSNGLNYIKAMQEAKAAGCDDALMLTIKNEVSELTSANIFWVKDHRVFTPSEQCDILPGITRYFVLEMLHKKGILVEEESYSAEEVKKADAVFCTNSLKEIAVISSLGEIQFNTKHPLLTEIKEGFKEFRNNNLSYA